MRVLALDIGERRVGVAVSDDAGRVAIPLEVIDAGALRGDFREIVEIVDRTGAEMLIIGLPLSLDGREGPQARGVRDVGERLAQFLRIPVRYVDERLSSTEAKNAARAAGVTQRALRGRLDAAAAAVFLQSWLDVRRDSGSDT